MLTQRTSCPRQMRCRLRAAKLATAGTTQGHRPVDWEPVAQNGARHGATSQRYIFLLGAVLTNRTDGETPRGIYTWRVETGRRRRGTRGGEHQRVVTTPRLYVHNKVRPERHTVWGEAVKMSHQERSTSKSYDMRCAVSVNRVGVPGRG